MHPPGHYNIWTVPTNKHDAWSQATRYPVWTNKFQTLASGNYSPWEPYTRQQVSHSETSKRQLRVHKLKKLLVSIHRTFFRHDESFIIANVNKPCLNFMENLLPSSTFPETASALRLRRKHAWERRRQSAAFKLEPLLCHRCLEMRKIRQTCCHACMKLEESTVAGMARRAIGYVYIYICMLLLICNRCI